MKQLQNLLLLSLFGGASASAMSDPKVILVKNSIGLNRDLMVEWQKNNSEAAEKLARVIPAGVVQDINFDRIADEVTFSAGGDYVGYTAFPVSVNKEGLRQAFRALNPAAGDNLEMEVLQSWSLQLYLNYHLAGNLPLRRERRENVLCEFPRLASYLPKLPGLTEEMVNGLGLWFKVVEQFQDKKAGDIYRYILGLPKNYTKEQVEDAYKTLALQWHPDKNVDKEYAERVFKLIGKAHSGLMKSVEKDSWKYYRLTE